MKTVTLALLVVCYTGVQCEHDSKLVDVSTFNIQPCKGSKEIMVSNGHRIPLEEGREYYLFINSTVTKNTKIIITLDSDGSIIMEDKSFARVFPINKSTFEIRVFKIHNGITLTITGLLPEIPYIKSLIINNKEYCNQPLTGYLDDLVSKLNDDEEELLLEYVDGVSGTQDSCNRLKVVDTTLNDSGASTKPGDWPSHTAIYKHDNTEIKYICGGTLISKNYVLTAAQCTSVKGTPLLPEMLSVFLGKFNLIGGDIGSQERRVEKIISHEQFDYQNLDNDIALLKLKTNIVPSEFVQPACLWHSEDLDKISSDQVLGTIVGWGFDTKDSWSPHLQQVKMPMVTQFTCLKSNPLVYSAVLNDNKFCAGYGLSQTRGTLDVGTSNCNGDSGSAFQIFVPDKVKNNDNESLGSWYVRGIVSLTVSRRDSPKCDPQQYVVFTDVEKYRYWIDFYVEYEDII